MIDHTFCKPPRPDGWTADEVDGALLVSPWPGLEHQRLLGNLMFAFTPVLPEGAELLTGVNIRLAARRLLTPDLVILNCAGVDTVAYAASDVLLAVEIVSPSSKVQDRILKRAIYAEALIPYYLLVEPGEPIAATLFALEGDEYEPIAKSDKAEIELTRPFNATIRLA